MQKGDYRGWCHETAGTQVLSVGSGVAFHNLLVVLVKP